jgi:hypothetical protein
MNDLRNLIRKELKQLLEQRETWSLEKLKDLTQQYNDLSEFLSKEKKAAHAMRRKGVFDEYTSHMTRPQKKYTDNELFDIASKYKTISDLKKERAGVYSAIMRRGLLDKLRQVITPQIVNWTDEMLRDEALKYTKKSDFIKNSGSAYATAHKRGILDDITKHMDQIKIWTYDEAREEAMKYKDYNEFSKFSPAFYQSKRNGWIEDFKQFLPVRIQNWTKELAHKEALKYKTKNDFKKGSPKAYSAAHSNGWVQDITQHMDVQGSRFKRLVYVYEFPDNSAYIGLTYNKKKRELGHFDLENPRSQVARHILKTKLVPEYKEISTFMDAQDAANLENCTIETYRNNGWIILNKQKGGNLGACQRTEWTMEKIRDLAQSYNSRRDFKKDHKSVYAIAQKYGWLDDVFANIKKIDQTVWTYDKTKEFAKNFKSRSEMKYANQSAYQSARMNGWLDEFFPKKYENHSEKK